MEKYFEEINEESVIEAATRCFLESAEREEFNGPTAAHLSNYLSHGEDIRAVLARLAKRKSCTLTFASAHINPNIKRLPDLDLEIQLALLSTEMLAAICVYPSRVVLEAKLPQGLFATKPFSRELALATAQLDFVGFQLAVMDRYVQDPNYEIVFNDYMGVMSIKDSAYLSGLMPDRDKVSLQTFGLGFESNGHPCIVVFYRYLAGLSPEHQQYWRSFKLDEETKMTFQYFQSSIEGQFWENRSARHGLECEIKLINEMTIAIWGKPLFRVTTFPAGTLCITAFSRPTVANFNAFIQELDKILSDNIDVKFFDNFSRTKSPEPDIEQRKGSIQLLRDWLLTHGTWESTKLFDEIIVEPIRAIRNARNKASHTLVSDSYSTDFYKERKRHIWRAFNSLANIRAFLSNHYMARAVKIPDWLEGDKFDIF